MQPDEAAGPSLRVAFSLIAQVTARFRKLGVRSNGMTRLVLLLTMEHFQKGESK
jgi:hypothetical protein